MVSALPLEPVKHSRINVAVGWRASYAAGGSGGGFGGLGSGGFGSLGGSMGNPSTHSIISLARMEVEAMFIRQPWTKVISPLPIALVEGR
jgi:hypothetical protein